jgi:hypothetical protein
MIHMMWAMVPEKGAMILWVLLSLQLLLLLLSRLLLLILLLLSHEGMGHTLQVLGIR